MPLKPIKKVDGTKKKLKKARKLWLSLPKCDTLNSIFWGIAVERIEKGDAVV